MGRVDIRPAGDGWRAVVSCSTGGCDGTAVVTYAHIIGARCGTCLRRAHGVTWSGRRPLPAGVRPVGNPAAVVPRGTAAVVERMPPALRGTVIEVPATEVPADAGWLPGGARSMAARAVRKGRGPVSVTYARARRDARVMHSVAVRFRGGWCAWSGSTLKDLQPDGGALAGTLRGTIVGRGYMKIMHVLKGLPDAAAD